MEESIQCPDHSYFIIGGSVTGPSHVKAEIPCQDASAFQVYPSAMAVLCVADGAGSAKHSEIGAQTAIAATLKAFPSDNLASLMDEDAVRNLLRDTFLAARRAVEEKSKELNCSLRDLASTLLVAVMHNESVAVGHVGDGAVVVATSTGLTVLSPPEENEYTNETTFLTTKTWEQSLRIHTCLSDVQGVAIFSDGCQRAALAHKPQGWVASAGFLGALFTYAGEIESEAEGTHDIRQLLESEKVCNNCDDDKSLLIAVTRPQTLGRSQDEQDSN